MGVTLSTERDTGKASEISRVSLDTYLHSSWSPDVDYVDGEIQERNLGERDHALIQLGLGYLLQPFRKSHDLWVLPEQRIRVNSNRFRVPDLCVVKGKPATQVLENAPFIVIEILSKDDTLHRLSERVDDYLGLGVPHVWLVDPSRREAWVCSKEGWMLVTELRTQDPAITIAVEPIFADLD